MVSKKTTTMVSFNIAKKRISKTAQNNKPLLYHQQKGLCFESSLDLRLTKKRYFEARG
jgi:hypothetical protein